MYWCLCIKFSESEIKTVCQDDDFYLKEETKKLKWSNRANFSHVELAIKNDKENWWQFQCDFFAVVSKILETIYNVAAIIGKLQQISH